MNKPTCCICGQPAFYRVLHQPDAESCEARWYCEEHDPEPKRLTPDQEEWLAGLVAEGR